MERDQYLRYALPISPLPDGSAWPPMEQSTGVSYETILPLSSSSHRYVVSIEPVLKNPACFVTPSMLSDSVEDNESSENLLDPGMCDFDMAFVVYASSPVGNGNITTVGPASVTSPAGSTASTALSFSQQSSGKSPTKSISGSGSNNLQHVKVLVRFDQKYCFSIDLSALKGASVVPATDDHDGGNRKHPPSLVLRFRNCFLRIFPLVDIRAIGKDEAVKDSQHQHEHDNAQYGQGEEQHSGESDGSVNSRNHDNLLNVLDYLQKFVLKTDQYYLIFQESSCETPIKKTSNQVEYTVDEKEETCESSTKLNEVFNDTNDRTAAILKYTHNSLDQGLKRLYDDIDKSFENVNTVFSIMKESSDSSRNFGEASHLETLKDMNQLLNGSIEKSFSRESNDVAMCELGKIDAKVMKSSQQLENTVSLIFPAPRAKQTKMDEIELKRLRQKADQLVQEHIVNVAQRHICSTVCEYINR